MSAPSDWLRHAILYDIIKKYRGNIDVQVVQLTLTERKKSMAEEVLKVWRNDKTKKMYHDQCFEEGESRDGFTLISQNQEFDDDDECASCGVSLAPDEPDVDDEDEDVDDEPEQKA